MPLAWAGIRSGRLGEVSLTNNSTFALTMPCPSGEECQVRPQDEATAIALVAASGWTRLRVRTGTFEAHLAF